MIGCGSQPTATTDCVSGQTTTCACPGASTGTRTCGPSLTFGACVCDGSDAGALDSSPADASPADAPPADVTTSDLGAADVGGASRDAGVADVGVDVPVVTPACPTGMVYVPPAMFTMGRTTDFANRYSPAHPVRLSGFCIDLTEVTVAAFGECVAASACAAPDAIRDSCNWGMAARADHPANCLSWTLARTYCQWRGGDLPTEAQWEYAARGTDDRVYPWGTSQTSSVACWQAAFVSHRTTCPVRSFPAGRSPFGLFDMTGNVAEWVRDAYSGYDASTTPLQDPYNAGTARSSRITRGGQFDSTDTITGSTYFRDRHESELGWQQYGFRCSHPTL
ncbi:MAG: serine/threonine kinase [Myxococcaceae bacterium]|nr:serine/threonine kinase [Myxococcaceae bacterium]